ncbi:MAG: trypsin-like serine protease [Chitinivibrionales bacterium]|nr:trypsin-like serine protease [Chitinivibrionales bacterium]MBD3355902.1 trypsin-like serine protease [Chitinivibrionales bacterium]
MTVSRALFTTITLLAVSAAPGADALLEYERNTIDVFRKSSPSVVFITSKSVQWDLWSMNVFEIPQGSGSGFIWDNKGHIVTNFHVIKNADNISVTLSNRKSYEASVVGIAPNKDLAVIKIKAPAEELRPLTPGSVTNLKVGRKVLAIGNPFGLDQTLTVGVVSALGRQIKAVTGRTIHDVIQTDAAINPGNSGGPLLDSRGYLVGVNTSIMTPSGASAGIGFAVPVNTVKRVIPQLIQYGKVIRPGLGVELLPDNIMSQYGIAGVGIARTNPGSAAERAGLRGLSRDYFGRVTLGDVIIAVDGKKIANSDELAYRLEQHKVGDSVTVTVLRGNKKINAAVVLQRVE